MKEKEVVSELFQARIRSLLLSRSTIYSPNSSRNDMVGSPSSIYVQ
jgi:hypothetical protein